LFPAPTRYQSGRRSTGTKLHTLMAFATSAVEDATALGEHAQRLLELSRGFYYESLNATTVYERSQANIAAWLREQASRIEGASGDQSRAAQA